MHEEVGSQFYDEGETAVDYLLGSFAGVEYGGYRLRVASGGMPGAASRLTMVPSENVVIALLSNTDNIDLWAIEKTILETMLADFADEEKTDSKTASDDIVMDRIPPGSFIGSWAGQITTYVGKIAVEMAFPEDGEVSMKMEGQSLPRIDIKTPLGEMGFKKDVFKGLFMGTIDTPDAARSPHVVLVECRRREDRLIGTVSAVAMNKYFCLPQYLELSRSDF
jgi:hypothetical protein